MATALREPKLPEETTEFVRSLFRDIARASAAIGLEEARFLVDTYYQLQRDRIRTSNQVRSAHSEPTSALSSVGELFRIGEQGIKSVLGRFAAGYRVGKWLQGVTGIGPVMSAGLLAHLDIRKASTAGSFWNFAGLNPDVLWSKGEKRPWNASLKTLCFKAGESFVKTQRNAKAFYGPLFTQRKRKETEMNFAGKLEGQARLQLEKHNYKKTTDAYKWYSGRYKPHECLEYRAAVDEALNEAADEDELEALLADIPKPPLHAVGEGTPMLPPAHIHARARRWAVKLFLSHVHHRMHVDYHGTEPPTPYSLAGHANGQHVDYIPPPGQLPLKGARLKDLYAESQEY